MSRCTFEHSVIVIGAGPAGLMAAEIIASAGYAVSVLDAMPSVGRKFLLAGVGGMNITHAEPFDRFIQRYSEAEQPLTPIIEKFTPNALREWVHGLGIETFVGSSDRVFPKDMKAAPLLRAWLHRLKNLGVAFYSRHKWVGMNKEGYWCFENHSEKPCSNIQIQPQLVVLALGGASWQRLGSDAAWVPWLRELGMSISPFEPSNCGFLVEWSRLFREQYAGAPIQGIGVSLQTPKGRISIAKGEVIAADYGLEGTSIYALSARLRDAIRSSGQCEIQLDLLPEFSLEKIKQQLSKPQGKNSATNFLRKLFNLSPVKIALLREVIGVNLFQDVAKLACLLKALPINLTGTRPIDEAISCAGGIDWSSVNSDLQILTDQNNLPPVFCAGEMLNWEAPTGGYLLTACFATGKTAGEGVVKYLSQHAHSLKVNGRE